MKTFLQALALLVLIAVLAGLAVGVGFCLAGASSPDVTFSGVPMHGAPRVLGAAFGLFIAAVALPFLLPLIIPLVLIFVVVLATRHSRRPRAA
jgi:hypothetical protein